MLLGLTVPSDGLEGESGSDGFSSGVQAVVAMAGMVEAVSFFKETNVPARVAALLGGTPQEVPDQYRMASPINYVRKDNPPVLFLQGDRDGPCPRDQAEALARKAEEVGSPFTLVIERGASHRAFYDDPQVWAFLDKHLKGPSE